MTYVKANTGGRKGPIARTNNRRSSITVPDPLAAKLYARAVALLQEIWMQQRWKTSIATKAGSYADTLLFERKSSPPKGLPTVIVRTVRQCVARACLEFNVTGLPVQDTPWYPQAEAEARKHMPSS